MLVYRLETENCKGPFNSGKLYDIADGRHGDMDRYPTTFFAFLKYDMDRAMGLPHGCKSLRELLYWFPAKVIRQMREHGYGVAVYEVHGSHVIFGKFQLVFDPTYAKRIQFK